ncbi:hypothetical protein EG834_16330, partial [bacterium]|nr:hypothetical protein [bacterium]
MIRKRLLDPRDSEAAPPENELFRAAYLLGKRRVIPVTPSLLRETLGARAGSVFERVCGWPFYRFAVWSGALVFLVTGAAKVHWLYVASEGELVRRNHLFEFLSDAQTLALAATLEIIVAVYALAAFGRRPKLASAK